MRSAFGASALGIEKFVHETPSVRVVFGAGSNDQIPLEAAGLGGTVLLIAGRRQVSEADRVATELGQRCVGRIAEVTEHVPAKVAEHAIELAREVGAGTVVCLGGCSAVGLAKAVALRLDVAILAVPTTYAGSEQTPIWGPTEAGRKITGLSALLRDALVGRRPDVGADPDVGAQLGRAADPAAQRASA